MADHLAKTEAAPPLRTWLFVVLFFVALIVLIWKQLPDDWQANNSVVTARAQRADLCETRWDAQTPWASHQQNGVLAIGSSLFHAASGTRSEFINRLGSTVAWENCWINSGGWGDFARLQPAAVRLKPALVLLHSDALIVFPWRQRVFAAFNSAVKDKIRGAKEQLEPDLYERPFICDRRSVPQTAHYYAQLYRADPHVFAQARQWLLALKATGAKVVIVEIPRAPVMEAQMGDFLPQWRQALQQLANDSGAQYWQLQAPQAANAYCADQAHLDSVGRQQTAALLSAFVLKTLAEESR